MIDTRYGKNLLKKWRWCGKWTARGSASDSCTAYQEEYFKTKTCEIMCGNDFLNAQPTYI